MKKLFLLSSFFFIISSFGYTSEDTSNATFLADQGIVTKQTVVSQYRLDDKILRQEAIGMALKVKGVTLPENYTCKKYFADATKNDWVCRAVELAADNGIITRTNKYANPTKYVTRAEALAMMMKAGGIEIQKSIGMSEGFAYYDKDGNLANDWQSDVLETARILGIMNPASTTETHSVGGNSALQQTYFKYYGRHNDLASRAEVFGFAKNIISVGVQKNNTFEIRDNNDINSPDEPNILYLNSNIEVDRGYISNAKIIKNYLIYDWSLTDIASTRIYSIKDNKQVGQVPLGQLDNQNTYIFGCELMGWPYCKIFSLETGYLVYSVYRDENVETDIQHISGTKFKVTLGAEKITIDVSQKITTIKSILDTYYSLIELGKGAGTLDGAYSIRSPTGVSLATFESWYKNTTAITFREDTMKDLGDNTYEFLVDMIEGGVKSTYKVKSKVNLEKFTIDNISSVKQ